MIMMYFFFRRKSNQKTQILIQRNISTNWASSTTRRPSRFANRIHKTFREFNTTTSRSSTSHTKTKKMKSTSSAFVQVIFAISLLDIFFLLSTFEHLKSLFYLNASSTFFNPRNVQEVIKQFQTNMHHFFVGTYAKICGVCFIKYYCTKLNKVCVICGGSTGPLF